jgi:hypothetical protein
MLLSFLLETHIPIRKIDYYCNSFKLVCLLIKSDNKMSSQPKEEEEEVLQESETEEELVEEEDTPAK